MDRKPAIALLLGLVTATGVWLLEISTPNGLGLIDDAISYIAAARALLSRLGFTRIWLASGLEPITHWPPGYPATLAAISFLLKIDPYRSARFLNMLVFGGNAALLVLLGQKMTKSYFWGALLSFLFLANSEILRLHAQALSEPLYLFVSLFAFLAFYNATTQEGKKSYQWLVLTGLLTGLSYITRYAALSLFATFIVAIFILLPAWRKRFISFGYFFIGAIPPILAWMLRNKLVGGSATNRAMRWHPVTLDNIQRGLSEFFVFIMPLRSFRTAWYQNYTVLAILLSTFTFALLFWLLPRGLKYFIKPQENTQPAVIPFTTALYIFGYMGSLLVSLTLFDAATPLNDRILSPVYVAVLMILVYFLHQTFSQGKITRKLSASAVAIFFMATFMLSQVSMINELKQSPTGFASWRWAESVVMETIRELPEDIAIYTNQPPAVYFWTGRASYIVWDVDLVYAEIEAGNAVLAYFPSGNPNTTKLDKLAKDLTPIQKSGLGNLYSK